MKTISVFGCPQINVCWSVYRGKTDRLEDFRRPHTRVWGWLMGRDNAWPLSVAVDDMGRVRMTLPPVIDPVVGGGLRGRRTHLTAGAYGLRLLWVKGEASNRALIETGRRNFTEIRNAILLVDDEDHIMPAGKMLDVSSVAATYGYDGLDAWEMAVMSGDTRLPKLEWLARLSRVVNSEGDTGGCEDGGASWVD